MEARDLVENAAGGPISTAEESLAALRRIAPEGECEIMLSTRSHSYEARVRSLSLIAQSWGTGTSVSGDDDVHPPAIGRSRPSWSTNPG